MVAQHVPLAVRLADNLTRSLIAETWMSENRGYMLFRKTQGTVVSGTSLPDLSLDAAVSPLAVVGHCTPGAGVRPPEVRSGLNFLVGQERGHDAQ